LTASDAHPDRVKLFPGDFNRRVDTVLCPEWLRPTEATFCLLDQHTFECEWATVRRLADYKRESEYKIELFVKDRGISLLSIIEIPHVARHPDGGLTTAWSLASPPRR
jgi:hypothetical protein